MEIPFITLFLLVSTIVYGSFGQTLSNEDSLKIPLFPPTVQNFVLNALRIFQAVYDDPDVVSVQKLPVKEVFSLFYDMVYKRNELEGNPNSKFHALAKAQSVVDNYDKCDGVYLQLASAYAAGELLLQNEVLTAENEKMLSSLFAEEILNSFSFVTNPSPKNYIRAGYDGYMTFLKSQGVISKSKSFTEPAVFSEVMNALKLYV